MQNSKREIEIRDEFIRLDTLLKLSGLTTTGGQAKILIQAGKVRVNGIVCTVRGKKMRPGDTAQCGDETVEVIFK